MPNYLSDMETSAPTNALSKTDRPPTEDAPPVRYLPLSDAATALGVTTKTVRRRIKENKLEIREDNGQVLVAVDESVLKRGNGIQLAPEVFEQLAERRKDSDMNDRRLTLISEQLASFRSFHDSVQQELSRSRLLHGIAWSGCIVLLLGLGIGAYLHRDTLALERSTGTEQLASAELEHQQNLTEAQADYLTDLLSARSEAAKAKGQAEVLRSWIRDMEFRLAETEARLAQTRENQIAR